MLRELKRAAQQRAGRLRVLHFTGNFVEVGFAVITGQLRLRIKQIHLARPTVHEQVNHRLGLGLEVGPMRFEVEHLSRCDLSHCSGQVTTQQRQQSRLAKPATHMLKKAAARPLACP